MSSPLITTPDSADFFVDDPCLNPKGQGAGNYTDRCLKDRILAGGCSGTGSWYRDPQSSYRAFAENTRAAGDIGAFGGWLKQQVSESTKDPVIAEKCLGEDIRTPCDEFLGNQKTPDQKCMNYLYTNASETNVRVGRAYPDATQSYTTLGRTTLNNGKTVNTAQFCLPGGSLNPNTEAGLAELQSKASAGYKGVTGLDAVKKYLSDVYNKAIGELDANKTDAEGGKKLAKMFRNSSCGSCAGRSASQ
jgi:hypothetical protein